MYLGDAKRDPADRVNHIQLLLISPSIGTDGWKILQLLR
jgi:hypothetical protein